MFKTLATLINGQHARAEDRVRDAFAIELIDQKIRQSDPCQPDPASAVRGKAACGPQDPYQRSDQTRQRGA